MCSLKISCKLYFFTTLLFDVLKSVFQKSWIDVWKKPRHFSNRSYFVLPKVSKKISNPAFSKWMEFEIVVPQPSGLQKNFTVCRRSFRWMSFLVIWDGSILKFSKVHLRWYPNILGITWAVLKHTGGMRETREFKKMPQIVKPRQQSPPPPK